MSVLPFIRSDINQLVAYTPNPGGEIDAIAAELGLTAPAPHLDPLDTNECPFDLPDDLKQKLAWALQREIASNRYPDGGHGALKAAIVGYLQESTPNAPIHPNQISVGNGSDELIRSLLIATCLQGEGRILVAEPTFSMYAILARTLGIPVETIGRTATFAMDLEAAQAALDGAHQPPVRVIFVVHPNSPTANALTEAELAWLRTVPEQILVVIDEAYFEFSQHTVVGELQHHPNWVVLRTFSKAFRLAAHRVGYGVGHPDLITALEKVRLPYNLPSLTQAAALTALNHRSLLLEAIPTLLAERSRLATALAQFPELHLWPSNANFLFVQLRESGLLDPDQQISRLGQLLKAQGTLVRHISGGLRITIGTIQENDRMIAHVQRALTHLGTAQ